MNIELLKLYNGDIIIGEIDDATITQPNMLVKNPRQIIMMPNMAGSMGVVLKPVCFPFKCNRLEKEISIVHSQIMFIMHDTEIDSELINGYKAEISGIKIASAAEAASIASASKSASSKEFII